MTNQVENKKITCEMCLLFGTWTHTAYVYGHRNHCTCDRCF